MITNFKILFNISIKHSYYLKKCQDFDFLIPKDTAALFKNGRIISKVNNGDLFTLFEADDTNTPLKKITDKTLRFGLQLNNSCFSNFTKMDIANPQKYFFLNKTTANKLNNAIGISLVGNIFSHAFKKTSRPVTVTLTDNTGALVQTDTIINANKQSQITYKLYNQNPGLYTITETYSSETIATTYYLDSELLNSNCFGIIEIKVANNFYSTPPSFEIKFDAKQEPQKYYIIAKNYSDADFNHLSVADNGSVADGRPKINFTKVAQASFTSAEINPSLLGDSSSKIVLFKSQAAVVRSEKARKNIQLTKNGDLIIKHLPQPSMDKNNSDMIIQISKP